MSQNILNKKRDVLHHLNVDIRARLTEVNRITDILSVDHSVLNQRDHSKVTEIPKLQLQHNSVSSKVSSTRKNISNNTFVIKQKPRKLRPYDPLYTWNRGGRLKELRIRCQARKYLHLWIRKTLGRVTEINATRFYRKQLQKKCWKIWYDQYWLMKIEPRLLGRAILHRKYIVMRSIIFAWNWWTKLLTLRRIKMDIAMKYNENNLKRMSISIWKCWVSEQKSKAKLRLLSETWTSNHLLACFFNLWKGQLFIQRDLNNKLTVALKYRRMILISKTWQQWIDIRADLRRENEVNRKASFFFQSLIQRRYFNYWTQYHHRYRMKQKEHDKWQEHYHWNLAKRFMKTWKELYVTSLTMASSEIKLKEMAKKVKMRRMFLAWRCYIIELYDQKSLESRAVEYYELTLKRKTWSSFVEHKRNEKLKSTKRVEGANFNNVITLRRYVHKWSEMLEHKDDVSRRVELGAARAHYRRTILIKSFHQFQQYVDQTKVKKERLKVGENFRRERILKRSITTWTLYCMEERRKKDVLSIMANYVKERVTRVLWNHWRMETSRRINLRNNLTEFIKHRTIVEKNNLLKIWRLAADIRLRRSDSIRKASEHYRRKVLTKLWQAMTIFVIEVERRRRLDNIASCHMDNHIIKKSFQSLRTYVEIKKKRRTLVNDHRTWKEAAVQKRVFGCWRSLLEDRRVISETVEDMYQGKVKQVLKERFDQWRIFGEIQKTKRNNSIRRVLVAREHMDEALRASVFDSWKQKTLKRISLSNKCIIAEDFCQSQLLTKMFYVWKLYVKDQHMKGMKGQEASSFYSESLKARSWVTWSKTLLDRQREQYYTKFALLHWASKLQGNVLEAWVYYTHHRTQRRENESEAFAIFQQRVRRYTIRQWLSSSDFLHQWRESQNKFSNHKSDLVYRAFYHWSQWTRNRTKIASNITDLESSSNMLRPGHDMFKPWSESNLAMSRPTIKIVKQITQARIMGRSAPKIPDFLLKSLEVQIDVGTCDIIKGYTVTHQIRDEEPIKSDPLDDELLPPASFCKSKEQKNNSKYKPKDKESCLQELNCIKARLLRVKETKDSLRQLKVEVREYERILEKLSVDKDSSFYQEFNPSEYKEELLLHIKDMEQLLSVELPICNELTKRAKALVKDLV